MTQVRRRSAWLRWLGWIATLSACGPQVAVGGADAGSGETGSSSSNGEPVDTSSSSNDSLDTLESADDKRDFPPGDDTAPPCIDCGALDVLFVIDNSGGTADMQLALARAMGSFVDRLSATPRSVQVMFTTTDVGNVLCSPFQPTGYAPAMGAPTTTGCNARIADFVGLGNSSDQRQDACTSVCPQDVVPIDPFVAFDTGTGDTNLDGAAVADGLACLLPQGINGCGYESPLEAMLLALDPEAPHNTGGRPFLRDDADLAIVIVTTESDCSLADPSVMTDESYYEVNPDNGNPNPSSAICWNAGVACTAPNPDGTYDDCTPTEEPLQPLSRYIDGLAGLRARGKHVSMLALGGVPLVLAYADDKPYEPIAGGLGDLVYRDWHASDLSASDLEDGVDAADLQFDFGIGPACAIEQNGASTIRAIPNPRLIEVCQSLDDGDTVGCCVDSVCGDHELALRCLLNVER